MARSGPGNADSVLVAALAAGASRKEAAGRAGVGERTVTRRLADHSFRLRLDAARAEMVARAVGQLADASAAATATLRALLDADAETVRLGAARAILELGSRLRESAELEARVTALESGQSTDIRSRWPA